jgi:hypothetical protein
MRAPILRGLSILCGRGAAHQQTTTQLGLQQQRDRTTLCWVFIATRGLFSNLLRDGGMQLRSYCRFSNPMRRDHVAFTHELNRFTCVWPAIAGGEHARTTELPFANGCIGRPQEKKRTIDTMRYALFARTPAGSRGSVRNPGVQASRSTRVVPAVHAHGHLLNTEGQVLCRANNMAFK